MTHLQSHFHDINEWYFQIVIQIPKIEKQLFLFLIKAKEILENLCEDWNHKQTFRTLWLRK